MHPAFDFRAPVEGFMLMTMTASIGGRDIALVCRRSEWRIRSKLHELNSATEVQGDLRKFQPLADARIAGSCFTSSSRGEMGPEKVRGMESIRH